MDAAVSLIQPISKEATDDEYDAWMEAHWQEHSSLVQAASQIPGSGQQVAALGQTAGAYSGLVNAANDAAAAAAGVAVGSLYRNGSVVMVRVS